MQKDYHLTPCFKPLPGTECCRIEMFILVEFTDQKELAVVPDIWLEGTSCAVWPNFTSESKLQRAVRSKQRPEDDWKAFPIRELYKHGKSVMLISVFPAPAHPIPETLNNGCVQCSKRVI